MINKETGECFDTEKKIILALDGIEEMNMSELARRTKLSKPWIKQKINTMNHMSILLRRETTYETMIRLNRKNIKIKFSTDRFRKPLTYLVALTILCALFGSIVLKSYEFIAGSLTSSIPVGLGIIYTIFSEKDEKKVFVNITN